MKKAKHKPLLRERQTILTKTTTEYGTEDKTTLTKLAFLVLLLFVALLYAIASAWEWIGWIVLILFLAGSIASLICAELYVRRCNELYLEHQKKLERTEDKLREDAKNELARVQSDNVQRIKSLEGQLAIEKEDNKNLNRQVDSLSGYKAELRKIYDDIGEIEEENERVTNYLERVFKSSYSLKCFDVIQFLRNPKYKAHIVQNADEYRYQLANAGYALEDRAEKIANELKKYKIVLSYSKAKKSDTAGESRMYGRNNPSEIIQNRTRNRDDGAR